jgi:hypothetical protein
VGKSVNNFAERRCGAGHPLVPVPGPAGVKLACLECLRRTYAGESLGGGDGREPVLVRRGVAGMTSRYTVAQMILDLETQEELSLTGQPGPSGRVPAGQAPAADALARAAAGWFGECTSGSLRMAVRELSRRAGEPVARVMAMTPDEVLPLLRRVGRFDQHSQPAPAGAA